MEDNLNYEAKKALSIGIECEIKECNLITYLEASKKAKGDFSLFMKYLIIENCIINGNKPTESDLDKMHPDDIIYISNAIMLMLTTDIRKKHIINKEHET